MEGQKKIDVYGVAMSSLEQMLFSKYLSNNGIAMNTKLAQERKTLANEWLNSKK